MKLYDAWLHGQARDLFDKDACNLTADEREAIEGPAADDGPWSLRGHHLRLVHGPAPTRGRT